MSEENIEVVREIWDAYSRGDFDQIRGAQRPRCSDDHCGGGAALRHRSGAEEPGALVGGIGGTPRPRWRNSSASETACL